MSGTEACAMKGRRKWGDVRADDTSFFVSWILDFYLKTITVTIKFNEQLGWKTSDYLFQFISGLKEKVSPWMAKTTTMCPPYRLEK